MDKNLFSFSCIQNFGAIFHMTSTNTHYSCSGIRKKKEEEKIEIKTFRKTYQTLINA